jgi:hypothetical protein
VKFTVNGPETVTAAIMKNRGAQRGNPTETDNNRKADVLTVAMDDLSVYVTDEAEERRTSQSQRGRELYPQAQCTEGERLSEGRCR